MSIRRVKTVKCPFCGKDEEVVTWASLNSVINPEMKEKVISGEVFQHICKC